MPFQDCSGAPRCKGAVAAISSFAAEEFERIAALSQTLLELMKHPRFYGTPALAAAQLATISELAEAACVSVDEMAANAGVQRTNHRQVAMQDALAAVLGDGKNVRRT